MAPVVAPPILRRRLDAVIEVSSPTGPTLLHGPSVLAEAMAQNRAILRYFSGILVRSAVPPGDVYLCTAAIRVGSFLAIRYKYTDDRRLATLPKTHAADRASGHASFPSGTPRRRD